jgi:hypothetical protein
MLYVLSQLIGFIGLLISFISFQFNKRSKILLLQIVVQCLFIIHYALLGAWVGSIMNAISAVRTVIFHQRETQSWANQRYWPIIFILIGLISGILTWKNYLSILPIIAMTFDTYASWSLKSKTIRFLYIVPRPMWFIYDLTVRSYPGLIGETSAFISVLIAILRFDIFHKSHKELKK